jgi:hypothetical protein
MKEKELNLPEFLLAEFPIKEKDNPNNQRHFIVHKGISLIEVIPLGIFTELLKDDAISKTYKYNDAESFILVYHTNNAHYHDIDQYELLDKAWQWYKYYLIWEDKNIEISKRSTNN